MSYILDALKKAQAEQSAEGVALTVTPNREARFPVGWIYILAVLLLVNSAVLAWFVLGYNTPSSPPPVSESRSAPETIAAPPDPAQELTASNTNPEPMLETTTPTRQVIANETTQPTPTNPSPNIIVERVSPSTSQSAPEIAAQLTLDELPPGERLLYEGFAYTSHIYTDDPELCAIVIDGQRLQQGDAFKGLKVHAITETGVIFAEPRRRGLRLVEVSPFE